MHCYCQDALLGSNRKRLGSNRESRKRNRERGEPSWDIYRLRPELLEGRAELPVSEAQDCIPWTGSATLLMHDHSDGFRAH